MKKRIWIGLCLLVLTLSGCGEASTAYFDKAGEELQEETEEASLDTQSAQVYETEADEECYVHICGAVVHPGVYKLPARSRIYEAISMAGGLLEGACGDSVNQAGEVTDGQMVKVLTEEEAKELHAQPAGQDAKEADGRVNINTADAAGLMELPGIGASKAESILSYREEKGGFSSIEEIKNITGIKEGVFSKIKDYITVN